MPQGSIDLLGVSEEPISLFTRSALEKGVTFRGNSRSDISDFRKAVELITDNDICRRYLPMLVSETIEVRTEDDIRYAFEQDILNDFKTVIKWLI
jgi:ribitol-5-phosphate 2-dehydrogenase